MKLKKRFFLFILTLFFITSSCDKFENGWGGVSSLPPSEWAPSKLTIRNNSITSKEITWTITDKKIDGYIIERKEEPGEWKEITRLKSSIYVDDDFAINTVIKYRIFSYVGIRRSSQTENSSSSKIPQPFGFSATSNSTDVITLSWIYYLPGNNGFKIDRKINDEEWELEYASCNATEKSFADNHVDYHTNDYSYRIHTYYNHYKSDYSDILIHIPEIGENYAGGIVFFRDDFIGGLVCAEQNLDQYLDWGCRGPFINNTHTSIGSGANNTIAIIEACNESKFAALSCNKLELNNKTDWYLPSKYELQLLYQNLYLQEIGNFTTNRYYWSSSEHFDGEWANAWAMNMRNGKFQISSKSSSMNVRPIRTF